MTARNPTETEVDQILAGFKWISSDISWFSNPEHSSNWAKFSVRVENEGDWNLTLHGNVQLNAPGHPPKRSFSLVLNRSHRIYSLDVNGLHENKVINNEKWNRRTHKQKWLEGYGDKFAFTPGEHIPEEPNAAFTEFCGEANIEFRGEITDVPGA